MEKTHNSHSPVILSKTKDGYEKIILNLNLKSIFGLVCCFVFSSASVFPSMAPLGLAFYAAVFSKGSWLASYLVSCFAFLFFDLPSPWVYVASLTLVTAALGVFDKDYGMFKTSILTSAVFFVLKLFFLGAGDFVVYDIFALVLESAMIFALVYIFEKSFPVITSLFRRTFISTTEAICTMTFLALAAMSLSRYEPIYGFRPSGVLSILFIYIFSLGGINGGAVILGVLLGTVGSITLDSFALVTSTYAFGALLGSALCSYGKPGVVLGFVIANTASSVILSDASVVAVSIYDSLAAALIFALIPQKLCYHPAAFFSKDKNGYTNNMSLIKRSQSRVSQRLDEMSKSFGDLAGVYTSGTGERELGRDYIMTKFREVTNQACMGCPSKAACFKNGDSKGYRHMSKMLETAFRTGKVTSYTMPPEFKSVCRRCDTFAEKFNAMFNVIRTEKLWLSKLNDSRRLISEQLQAISDALGAERDKCTLVLDHKLEETLWAEFDKAMLYPASVTAETHSGGSFCITVAYKENRLKNDTLDKTSELISSVMNVPASAASPVRKGEDVVYAFFPAQNYTVNVGYASKAKSGEAISGDSTGVISMDGKIVYAMLCDGMGSGEKAAEQSKAAITLMEKFIKAGFDSDTAVRLINSSLLLKSSRDSFSTVDLCKCNLSDASITFTKLGAAGSFIKSDDGITLVKGSGLPAGILREVEVENRYLSINSDTTVLLVSDGIADIALKNKDHEGWIEKALSALTTSNPQIIASQLMKKALSLQSGVVHDDMTVMVMSIKKV